MFQMNQAFVYKLRYKIYNIVILVHTITILE